jgi:hypothetical protein
MKSIKLEDDMLVSSVLTPIDYSDCFETKVSNDTFPNIDTFVRRYFETQPRWLMAISMNILKKETMQKALERGTFNVDESVGSWKVYARNEEEVVFGDDMGFMEYRFAVRLDDTRLRVSTVVQYKGKMGKYYFALVKLLHQKFVLMSLDYPLRGDNNA